MPRGRTKNKMLDLAKVGTSGKVQRNGVKRSVKTLANGNLVASGKYVLDELQGGTKDDPITGDTWHTTFVKYNKDTFATNFASTKYAPGGNHKEFIVKESPDRTLLSFYHIDSGVFDNSWRFCKETSDGTREYMDYNHGSISGLSKFCDNTAIPRNLAM